MTRSAASTLVLVSFMLGATAHAQRVVSTTIGFSIDGIAVLDARLSGDRDISVRWTTNLDERSLQVQVANAPEGLEAVEVTPAGSFGEHRSLALRPAIVSGAGLQSFGVVSRSAGGANLSIALRWSAGARPVPVSLQFSLAGDPGAPATVVVK